MLKQSLIYLIISSLFIIFSTYAQLLIVYVDILFTWVNVSASPLFNFFDFGKEVRQILILTFLPIVLAGIPALAYKFYKKKPMPYLIEIVWVLWLIILLCDVLIP